MPDISSLKVVNQKLEIDEIEEVEVTTAVLDEENGLYVREFKFFGKPASDSGPTLVLTVRTTSTVRAKLDVTAPEQQF